MFLTEWNQKKKRRGYCMRLFMIVLASTTMLHADVDQTRAKPVHYCYNFVTSKISTLLFATQASALPKCFIPLGTLFSGSTINSTWTAAQCDNEACGFIPSDSAISLTTIPYTDVDAMRTLITQRVKFFTQQAYNFFDNVAYERSSRSYATSNSPAAFVQQLFRLCGLYIPYKPNDQYKQSTLVSPKNLKPGDLAIFFLDDKKYQKIERISVYIGSGEFISCSAASVAFMIQKIPTPLLFGCTFDALSQNMKLIDSTTGAAITIRFCTFLTTTKDLKKMYDMLCS